VYCNKNESVVWKWRVETLGQGLHTQRWLRGLCIIHVSGLAFTAAPQLVQTGADKTFMRAAPKYKPCQHPPLRPHRLTGCNTCPYLIELTARLT